MPEMSMPSEPTVPNTADNAEGLHDLIRAERDEKARNLIESGEMGHDHKGRKMPRMDGDGHYANIFRAAMGVTETVRAEHLKHLQQEDEAKYPEIYLWKITGQTKRGNQRAINLAAQGADRLAPTHLTKSQFIDLYSAVSFANAQGVAMNVHVIIQWGRMGYTDHDEATKVLQDHFFRHLNVWYAYRNKVRLQSGQPALHPLFWIYTHECSHRAGFHTHILAGIPLEIRQDFREWVKSRIAPLSKITPAPKGIVKVVRPPSDPIGRQWRFFQYLCKGLDPAASVRIPRYDSPVPMAGFIQYAYACPGHIRCRLQVGKSSNLSPAKRKVAKFKSAIEWKMFHKDLLYNSAEYDLWHRRNAAGGYYKGVTLPESVFK